MQERIKHNYLSPEKGLSLDLTVKDAELLISASSRVRGLAETGELERIHKQCKELEDRIEGDYLAVRNHIGKILVQIEEKENELITKLEELGVTKLRKHSSRGFEDASLFDLMGLTTGDPSLDNLILTEAAVQKGGDNVEQLRAIQKKLHAYMGVKAKYFEIKVDMRFDYCRKVAKGDKVAEEELKKLVN